MKADAVRAIPCRNLLKLAGAAAVGGFAQAGYAAAKPFFLIIDPENSRPSNAPSMRAVAQLGEALGAKGVRQEVVRSAEATKGAGLCVILAKSDLRLAEGFPGGQGLTIAESNDTRKGLGPTSQFER